MNRHFHCLLYYTICVCLFSTRMLFSYFNGVKIVVRSLRRIVIFLSWITCDSAKFLLFLLLLLLQHIHIQFIGWSWAKTQNNALKPRETKRDGNWIDRCASKAKLNERLSSIVVWLKFWKSALIYRITPSAIPFLNVLSSTLHIINVYQSRKLRP